MLASPNGGRSPGPAPEGSCKGSNVSVAQAVGDIFQRHGRTAQNPSRRIEANRIEKRSESCPLLLQTPGEGPSVHPEGARHLVLADAPRCQKCSHHPLNSILGNIPFPDSLFLSKLRREEIMEKGIRAGNWTFEDGSIKYHGIAVGVEANRGGEM
jgi:hypothetical protein